MSLVFSCRTALTVLVPAACAFATPAAAQLISIDARILDIDARVTVATGRIALIEGQLVNVEADLSQLVAANVDLDARVNALNGGIVNASSRIDALNGGLIDANARIDANIQAVAAVDARVDANVQAIADLGNRVDANGQAIVAIDARVGANSDAIAGLDGRVGRIETDIAAGVAKDIEQDARLADHSTRIDAATALASLARDEGVALRADVEAGRVGLVRQDAATGAISIGAQSGGDVVSLAGMAGDRRLTGLADGLAANDAVTVGQMERLANATYDASRLYTDQAVSAMVDRTMAATASMMAENNRVLRADMNALAANGAALSGLPQSFIPGRGMAGAAIGGHGGEVAFALGLSKAFDGERAPAIRAGAAMDTRRGEVSYNASVGFHF